MPALTQQQAMCFFSPRSVAIVGASTKTGPKAYNLLENLLREQCSAELFPVNNRVAEVLGLKAYASVRDLPKTPDLAILTLPREVVIEALQDCLQREVPAVVIISQGFSDADEQGRLWQAQMQQMLQGSKTRVVGPNSIGLANAFEGFHTSFQKFDLIPKANAMICQSGMFILASADFATGLGLGVDIGNAMDVDFPDLLPYLAQDDRIRVINLHMEGLRNAEAFLKLASRITPTKPIVAYKVGKSEAAANAAASHSGALAGDDRVFDAAFEKAGVLRVDSLDEMQHLNKALLTFPRMAGRRVAVVTLSGGGGIALLDALVQAGLEVAQLNPQVDADLQALNPPWLGVSNPVDTWMASLRLGLAEASQLIVGKLLDSEEVDALVVLLNSYRTTGFEVLGDMIEGLAAQAKSHPGKPVAVWAFGLNQEAVIQRAEATGVLAGFRNPEAVACALAGLFRYHHRIRTRSVSNGAKTDSREYDVDRNTVRRVLDEARAKHQQVICGSSFGVLQAYGLNPVPWVLARDEDQLLMLAEAVAPPWVLKIDSQQVVHKSDSGGVALNLRNISELEAAVARIIRSIQQSSPGAQIAGWLLQSYSPAKVELFLGGKQTPFGPSVLVGLGGLYAEILNDISVELAPFSLGQAIGMLRRLKSWPILAGTRGQEGIGVSALAEGICKLGQLLLDFPEIQELDINPLHAEKQAWTALDARIVLGAAHPHPNRPR